MQEDKFSTDFFTDASVAPLAAAMHAHCFTAPWNESDFISALEIPGTLLEILSVSGKPAAFSLYRTVMDEAEILTLGTLPGYRGKRIATYLLNQGIAKLRESNVRFLYLEVGSQNLAAQRLYYTTGFKEIGRRRNYYNHYAGTEDAITMKKILQPIKGEKIVSSE